MICIGSQRTINVQELKRGFLLLFPICSR